jgi:genome maintenance exonuclease 1
MQWNNKFIYPKSSRSIDDGLRKYLINGEKLPSVTSVLDFTKSEEDKAALANWRNRTGEDLANKIQKDAAKRGGKMHAFIEQYLLGKLNLSFFEKNEQFQKMAEIIIKEGIKGRLQEIWGVEATLTYPKRYGGTADCLGIFEEKEACIDFKQSNKLKKIDFVQDWFHQLGAYSLAHNVVYGTNITSGVILLCTVDFVFQEFKVENDELIMYQNLFLGRLKKFNEMKNLY